MGYSKDIYDDAFEELKARRNKAEYDAMIKHSALIKKLPRVQEIEESLAKTSTMAARAVFADRISVREMLEKLKTQNLALQMELKTILEKNGYPSDYLDVHYSCKECSDMGYIDGKMCLCLKNRRLIIKTSVYFLLYRFLICDLIRTSNQLLWLRQPKLLHGRDIKIRRGQIQHIQCL